MTPQPGRFDCSCLPRFPDLGPRGQRCGPPPTTRSLRHHQDHPIWRKGRKVVFCENSLIDQFGEGVKIPLRRFAFYKYAPAAAAGKAGVQKEGTCSLLLRLRMQRMLPKSHFVASDMRPRISVMIKIRSDLGDLIIVLQLWMPLLHWHIPTFPPRLHPSQSAPQWSS